MTHAVARRKLLVACEFSGTVRDAFKDAGWDAWSCDLLPTETPGQHYQGDVREVLGNGWDMLIAHPPCTHLAVSGARWWAGKRQEQREAIEFARLLIEAPIAKVCVENPIGKLSTAVRKPDQIVQPWQFGHDASKATCLWLKGLPKLSTTKEVAPRVVDGRPRWSNQTDSGQNRLGPSADRWKLRAETYQGIAQAMAAQWGNLP